VADQVEPPQQGPMIQLGIVNVPAGVAPVQSYVFGFTAPDPESPLHPGFVQIAFLFADGTMRLTPIPFEIAKWLRDRLDAEIREMSTGLKVATQADIIALHDGDRRVPRG
jgi:hypothetical protein